MPKASGIKIQDVGLVHARHRHAAMVGQDANGTVQTSHIAERIGAVAANLVLGDLRIPVHAEAVEVLIEQLSVAHLHGRGHEDAEEVLGGTVTDGNGPVQRLLADGTLIALEHMDDRSNTARVLRQLGGMVTGISIAAARADLAFHVVVVLKPGRARLRGEADHIAILLTPLPAVDDLLQQLSEALTEAIAVLP